MKNMKITYLKLKNFAGIYAGLGKTEIEMNLDSDKNITVLLGANGSGKTSLLSVLHPYRETFDNRKTPIRLKDDDSGKIMNGYKEIHYQVADHKLIIKHFYSASSSKNKSYIEVDGTELNENGNIRSCEKIISEQLSVSKDYFIVGRLGDNVTNFINYPTSKRKDYINNFVPNIDGYLTAFQQANDKYKVLNSYLKSLHSELSKYPEYSLLEENYTGVKDTMDSLTQELTDLTTEQGKLKATYESLNKSLDKIDLSQYDIVLQENEDKLNTLQNLKSTVALKQKAISKRIDEFVAYLQSHGTSKETIFKKNLNDFDKRINELNMRKKEFDLQIEHMEQEKQNILDTYNSVSSQISNKQLKIKSLTESVSQESLEDLNSSYQSFQNDYNDALNTLKELQAKTVWMNFNLEEIDDLKNKVNQTNRLITNIKDDLSPELQQLLSEKSYDLDQVKAYLLKVKEKSDNMKIEVSKINEDIQKLSGNDSLAELVQAHQDHLGSCPFKSILLSSNLDDFSIEHIQTTLSTYDQQIRDLDNYYMKPLEDLGTLKRDLSMYVTYLNSDKSFIDTLAKFGSIDLTSYNVLTDANPFMYSHINEIITNNKDIINYQINLEQLQTKMDSLESKIKSTKIIQGQLEELSRDIKQLEQETVDQQDKINKMDEQLKVIQKNSYREDQRISILSNIKDKYSQILDLQESLSNLNNLLTDFNDVEDQYQQVTTDLDMNKNKSTNIQIKINSMKRQQEQIFEQLSIIKNTNKSLEKIDKILEPYRLVKEAVDPKKGIPLVFSNIYLKSIAEEANTLLNIAYNGSFFIDIEVTKKDFFVHVYKDDGTMLNDILEASQGEQSLTNLSLSLALLVKVTSGYNILYLDEVDGVLSSENRMKFLQMLEKQIDELGIEQVFVISHNDSFDSSDINMILLKGHTADINNPSFMQGKKILYNVEA